MEETYYVNGDHMHPEVASDHPKLRVQFKKLTLM